MDVKGLARQGEVASPMASDWVGCGWMSWATSFGIASQLYDELRLGDQLADASAHQVHAERRAAASCRR